MPTVCPSSDQNGRSRTTTSVTRAGRSWKNTQGRRTSDRKGNIARHSVWRRRCARAQSVRCFAQLQREWDAVLDDEGQETLPETRCREPDLSKQCLAVILASTESSEKALVCASEKRSKGHKKQTLSRQWLPPSIHTTSSRSRVLVLGSSKLRNKVWKSVSLEPIALAQLLSRRSGWLGNRVTWGGGAKMKGGNTANPTYSDSKLTQSWAHVCTRKKRVHRIWCIRHRPTPRSTSRAPELQRASSTAADWSRQKDEKGSVIAGSGSLEQCWTIACDEERVLAWTNAATKNTALATMSGETLGQKFHVVERRRL